MLAPVSLGEKSVSILCRDELNGLWRQTFDVSDVAAGQDDVTGLIPHMHVEPQCRRVSFETDVFQRDLPDQFVSLLVPADSRWKGEEVTSLHTFQSNRRLPREVMKQSSTDTLFSHGRYGDLSS